MKNLLSACLSVLLLAGCTGGIWPEPGTPKPETPEQPNWLLTKVTKRLKYEFGYVHITKTVNEYLYNEHHKPIVHRYYSNAADSSNLMLVEVDSLFYDDQQRVVQINHFSVTLNRVGSIRKLVYSGNNRLPYRVEQHTLNDSLGNPRPYPGYLYHYDYTYQDSVVIQVANGNDFSNDTAKYHYNAAGNYIFYDRPSRYAGGAFVKEHEFDGYDNAPNPARYFNLEHGFAFIIDDVRSLFRFYAPLVSKNNWTSFSKYSSSQLPRPYVVRTVVVNGDGLVVETNSPYGDFGNRPYTNENIVYEYEQIAEAD